VLGWLRELGIKSVALGLTKDGHLNHPLYVPYSVEPVAVEGRRSAGSYSVIRQRRSERKFTEPLPFSRWPHLTP
jgi:hypothetical protein